MDRVDKKSKGYWTKEKCAEEALKYKTKNELYRNSSGAYMSMFNNNWLDELCPHMKTKMPNGYWTKEKCAEEALKYDKKSEFQAKSGSAYCASRVGGWLNEMF